MANPAAPNPSLLAPAPPVPVALAAAELPLALALLASALRLLAALLTAAVFELNTLLMLTLPPSPLPVPVTLLMLLLLKAVMVPVALEVSKVMDWRVSEGVLPLPGWVMVATMTEFEMVFVCVRVLAESWASTAVARARGKRIEMRMAAIAVVLLLSADVLVANERFGGIVRRRGVARLKLVQLRSAMRPSYVPLFVVIDSHWTILKRR